MITKQPARCQCMDPHCPYHVGSDWCPNPATVLCVRIRNGKPLASALCMDCCNDAAANGDFLAFGDIDLEDK